jgi:UDPglucose 6-dehydrogenase
MKKIYPDIHYKDRIDDVAKGADALLILTEWPQFRKMNLSRIKSLMKTPILIDGRNIFDPLSMKKKGFHYQCIGRPLSS